MKTMKYPIKEVNVREIPNNRVLGVGISNSQGALCRKTIEAYGLLAPIVAVEKPDGKMVVLKGENELAVLKDMSVDRAEVFITHIKNEEDIGKAILLLSSMHGKIHNFSEGMVLKEIIGHGRCNQKQLAAQLGKSESWISKRLSLVERLDAGVAAMLLNGEIGPSIAQDIGRIPADVQNEFATNVRLNGIPKNRVEKLVSMYLDDRTPDSLRETIVRDPSLACGFVGQNTREKIAVETDDAAKFEGMLRLLLKLAADIEPFFFNPGQAYMSRYSVLISAAVSSMEGLLSLAKTVSPGKPPCGKGKKEGADGKGG